VDQDGNTRVVNGGKAENGLAETGRPHQGTGGRQLAPGLLLMPDSATRGGDGQRGLHGYMAEPEQHHSQRTSSTIHTTATIAKELLDHGSSPTAEAILKSGHKPLTPAVVQPKQQLCYLADVLGITVQFTDFPKSNKNEVLSLVSLSTNPPQVSHGSGLTIEASHDQAALNALRALVDLGVDSLTEASPPVISASLHHGSGSSPVMLPNKRGK